MSPVVERPIPEAVLDRLLELEPRRPLTRILLENETIPAGQEKRLMPGLDVSRYDRLHVHIGANARSVANLHVRILFATPMSGTHCGALLADSTVWFEETVSEREFSFSTPPNYGATGFVMSVPVIAPQLYDIIIRNIGSTDVTTISVGLMAQEI